MGARSKRDAIRLRLAPRNSRVPRWGHDQNLAKVKLHDVKEIAECPDGGTIKTGEVRGRINRMQ